MATANMVEKIKEIQAQAKDIDKACTTLLANPNLSEVIQLANMLEAFVEGKPQAVAKPAGTRKRRTQAEIKAAQEAEAAKLAGGNNGKA